MTNTSELDLSVYILHYHKKTCEFSVLCIAYAKRACFMVRMYTMDNLDLVVNLEYPIARYKWVEVVHIFVHAGFQGDFHHPKTRRQKMYFSVSFELH